MSLDAQMKRGAQTGLPQTAFIWPFRHKRVRAEQDHSAIAQNIAERQADNRDTVLEVFEEAMEEREDALERVAEEIARLAAYIKKNGRDLAEQIRAEQKTLEDFKHILAEGRALGAATSAIAILKNPQSGFPEDFSTDGLVIENGAVLIPVPAITGGDMLNLPEAKELIDIVEDKIGPGFTVSFEDRSMNDEDATFFREKIDEDDTETQRIMFSVVIDCSGAGHEHGKGEEDR